MDQLDRAARDLPDAMKERPVEQLAKAFVRMHRVFPLEHDWLRASCNLQQPAEAAPRLIP